MRRKRLVQHTHVDVVDHQKKVPEGEKHDATNPYHGWRDNQESHDEPAAANPDLLEDNAINRLWGSRPVPELAQRIISTFMDQNGEFPILSKKENLVLRYYTTGTMSMGEVGAELKISKGAVQTYLHRISRKFRSLLAALPEE